MFLYKVTTIEGSVRFLELKNNWLLSLNFGYMLQDKTFGVCPSVYVSSSSQIHIFFFIGMSAMTYTNIRCTFPELQYQYVVQNSALGAPLAVEAYVTVVISTVM